MKIAFFDTHGFDRKYFEEANKKFKHEIHFFKVSLDSQSAKLAAGFDCVCAFVNDNLKAETLKVLKEGGIRLVALRSAGFNHVDLKAAQDFGLPIVRVPAYSPYAVAEHAVALLMTLNRKTHKAYQRVRDANFSLDGLVGHDVHGKTVGVIGTGKIGAVFAKIMRGFGCQVLAFDLSPVKELQDLGVTYVDQQRLYQESDIVSLHVPLNKQTHHMIGTQALSLMRPGAILINTSRGGLIDTKALIVALKKEQLGGAALDVYEEEEGLFFRDQSEHVLQDDDLARLMTFPNVLITAHQAFLTHEALTNIAETTLDNVQKFESTGVLQNRVSL